MLTLNSDYFKAGYGLNHKKAGEHFRTLLVGFS